MQPINSGGEHDTVHDGHDVLKRTVRLSAAAIISSNGLIWMRQNQRFLNGVSNSKLMSFSSHNVKMKAFTSVTVLMYAGFFFEFFAGKTTCWVLGE